jgi:endoglucanase
MRLFLSVAVLAALIPAGALGEDGPWVLHVGTVAPEIIGITVQEGRIEHGPQVPYERQDGDELEVSEDRRRRVVRRNGEFLGWLVGPHGDLIKTEDAIVGDEFPPGPADSPESYLVRSVTDPAYSGGLRPTAVYRKSKPVGVATWNGWPPKCAARHVIYLRLPRPLTQGSRYVIEFADGFLPEQTLEHDPATTRSEAVHVSHLGFRPDDPAKVAFLSCWLGSGGGLSYGDGPAFEVVDDETGRPVLDGTAELTKPADEPEDGYEKNYNGTDVYEMDFSALTAPGTYRISVEGVGCSYPFEIGLDTWRRAFTVSARGFYHHRSGIALGPPHTNYVRPRCFHPDDGVRIYHSTAPLMDTGNGLNARGTDRGNFANLVAGKTDEVVPDAWGGYMDAGDWDRRIHHLEASGHLIDLAGLFPDYFAGVGLNIPESPTPLPDVVDEALFNLDCYRRMQMPDGGIRGGIESAEHPCRGEASWQESLDVMAYAPGVWSSHVYAGAAARAAHWLQDHDPDLAAVYRESSLRAMDWAERNFDQDADYPHRVRDDRNLAAAELFRLTGDARWHELFRETTIFTESGQDMAVWRRQRQVEAPWVYVRTDRPGMDERLRANCRAAIIKEADNRVANGTRTGFHWTKNEHVPVGWGTLGRPDGVSMLRAHILTGDPRYLRGLVLACQQAAGANPVNMCYTTGLGHYSPEYPLHVDSHVTGRPAPPGITVMGPFDVERHANDWRQQIVADYCYPPVADWPTLEAYWDVHFYAPICEYTIHSTIGPNAYVWGYLAARKGDDTR